MPKIEVVKRWKEQVEKCSKKNLYCLNAILIIILFFATMQIFKPEATAKAAENDVTNNRYNVVVITDASNSMNYTDPSGLRYEAISQFTNLLAQEGNYLGGIVFSNHVEAKQDLFLISKQEDKDSVIELMKSVMSTGVTNDMGYTNIGEALSEAVHMLEASGNPELPSVIVFLSDGNTEMPTEEEQQSSLDLKAETIQTAREKNISIYSVCLNANQKADSSEMKQISVATGGEFREVQDAKDLQEVFNVFYNLIYGTSTIMLADDTFTTDGKLETTFNVPGIGVEEVNIIIYGKTSNVQLINPSGEEHQASVVHADTFTMIKLTDVTPGTWKLVALGNPGDSIKVNMVYNTNLDVLISTELTENLINPKDAVMVKGYLKMGEVIAGNASQYVGYNACLQIMDAYGELVTEVPMDIKEDHFECSYQFEEGVYYFKIKVIGNHLERLSEDYGPLTVSSQTVTEKEKNNTAPTAVENPVEKTVFIWPFKENSFSVDLKSLAIDEQDDELKYKIMSSSFIEGEDYSLVEDDVLTINNFSLSKGAFTVSATDSGGLSCEIEVVIKSYNVGVMALIGIGMIIVVVLTVMGILLWIALTKPFRGTVSAQSYCNGIYKGVPRRKKRGRIKLAAFQMDQVGLDYTKSYVQATGQSYVYVITNKSVMYNGQKTNKIRVQSGREVKIVVSEDGSRFLLVRFDSNMNGRTTGGRGRRRPAIRR